MSSRTLIAAAAIWLLAAAVGQAAVSPDEQQKIEGLLKHVEGMTDAQFIRNGRRTVRKRPRGS